jgi:translation initiation factor 3 subunit A
LQVRGWEGWTAESIELHLQTRFAQLETASTLRLYTEGFRTVEDIYNILQISRTRRKLPGVNIPPPKAKIMAAYYEKLTNLFWVSENYLFHAFAWYKYYSLCKEYNRGMSPEMKKMQASAVLLAALCIPTTNSDINKGTSKSLGRDAIQSTVEDDIAKEKMARMATLLGFHTRDPSRDAILAEIRARNIIDDVPDYLRDLYVILEDSTDPLDMVEKARPLLDTLRAESATTNSESVAEEDNTLGRYVEPLTNMLILKLIFNLSAAYHTISLDHVKKLTSGLGVSFEQMEKSIILSAQSRALSVRIDHRAGCIRFGTAALESDEMRGQLSILAKRLTTACSIISPPEVSSIAAERAALYAEVRSSVESEHINTLERKVVIEKRKEEAERLVQERLRAEEAQRKAEELARKAEEDRRLAREQKMREKEKLQKIQEEMDAMEKKRYLTAMGRNVENMTVEELKEVDTAALAKEHADKANKKKEEAERKVKEAARQLDYLVRAVRIEELPRIKEAYDTKTKEDRTRYEQDVVDKATRAKNQWETDVKEKASLRDCSVFSYTSEFQSMIMTARTRVHEKLCKEEDERAELKAEKGKLARARKRKADEARRAEEAKIAAAKAEAERKAEEERQRKEEERRQRQEELEKKERMRMEEQREREQRERSERSQPAPVAAGENNNKYVPPSRRGGGGNRWGGGSGTGSSSDRGGGYGGGRYDGRDSSGSRPTNSRWS